MRAIEPQAMQLAWQAVTSEAGLNPIPLELEMRPWTLRCPQCRRIWRSGDLEAACDCGCDRAFPVGGDELYIASIEVKDLAKGVTPCACLLSKTS
jgi:Zn finger protein HypA/HybF involved in hydrogenase expression